MKFALGIIGCGVMANAILDGILNKKLISADRIAAYDIDDDKMDYISRKGVIKAQSANQLIYESEIVMLAVKPQHYSDILKNGDFSNTRTLISIMAGVKTSVLREKIGSKLLGIARVMPNTPCKIGEGFSALYFDNVNNADKEFVKNIFQSCGETITIAEEKFDAVTSVSGSGPAYVYMFLNGMIKGGMEGGLTYEQAKAMAVNTVIGAAKLAKMSEIKLDDLIEMVCSKGGTTIEAVNIYRQKGLEDIIAEGIKACRKKSILLSENL
ncbi:MAG: pyrroline-5-carboxylate reductase [Christensenellales bacterium]|jgi:pyrroline-5-carboxylate reductase|nr:pyrroline-5-carboxylate reductase [Clostridiales bacterium]